MGKRSPGVLGELFERLLFKGCRHGAGLSNYQQRQLGRKHHLVGRQYARLLMCPWHGQAVRCPRLQ